MKTTLEEQLDKLYLKEKKEDKISMRVGLFFECLAIALIILSFVLHKPDALCGAAVTLLAGICLILESI